MCLLKNQLPNISILWNTNTLLKPDSSMFILTESIYFSLAHSLLYLINFCITLLGFDDPLQQVWFHLQCCHKSLRNYLQSEVIELLTYLRWHTLSNSKT